MKSYLITIALLFTLLGTYACPPNPPEVQEPISVTAPDLLAEYLTTPANKIEELKYNNKQLLVSGVVAQVKPEDGLVILKGKEDPIILNGVECSFITNDENKESLKLLVRGQGIVVVGHNNGFNFGFVKLTRCILKGS